MWRWTGTEIWFTYKEQRRQNLTMQRQSPGLRSKPWKGQKPFEKKRKLPFPLQTSSSAVRSSSLSLTSEKKVRSIWPPGKYLESLSRLVVKRFWNTAAKLSTWYKKACSGEGTNIVSFILPVFYVVNLEYTVALAATLIFYRRQKYIKK